MNAKNSELLRNKFFECRLLSRLQQNTNIARMYVHMYACVCIYAYIYICVCVCVYVCMSLCMYVCMCICMYACKCVCVSMYVFMYVCL